MIGSKVKSKTRIARDRRKEKLKSQNVIKIIFSNFSCSIYKKNCFQRCKG